MRYSTICFAGWMTIVLAAAAITAGRVIADGAEWPQWRGPGGLGHSAATGLPIQWSETSNIAWKTNIPGRGWSSPVIQGSQIWLTTAVETAAKPEDAKRRLAVNTGDQPLNVLERVELRAICVDLESGRQLHDVLLIAVAEPQWVHALNSYASPSPVLDEGKLYCHFGAFGTACVDTSNAKRLWANTELQAMHENGPGGSPVVVGKHVVVQLDGSDQQYIAAIDVVTGKVAWKTMRLGRNACESANEEVIWNAARCRIQW